MATLALDMRAPVLMSQFQVRYNPWRKCEELWQWKYCRFGTNYQPIFIKEL